TTCRRADQSLPELSPFGFSSNRPTTTLQTPLNSQATLSKYRPTTVMLPPRTKSPSSLPKRSENRFGGRWKRLSPAPLLCPPSGVKQTRSSESSPTTPCYLQTCSRPTTTTLPQPSSAERPRVSKPANATLFASTVSQVS